MQELTQKEQIDFMFDIICDEFRDNHVDEFMMPDDVIYDLAKDLVLGEGHEEWYDDEND